MQRPEEYHEPDEENPPLSFPDSRLIGPSQDERAEMYTQLRTLAEFEAEARYASDIQNVLDRGRDWPTESALSREANTKAYVALRDYLAPSLDREVAKAFYVESYLSRYRALYERDTGNGTLPNEQMKQLYALAQQDARNDVQNGNGLQEPELTYQAVIRLQEFFGYRTQAPSGYLTHLMGHLPRYKQAYREEKDRPSRSSSFPAGGQPLR